MVYKIRATALILLVFLTPQSVPGQTPAPPAAKPAAVGLIKLTGDDEKRRNELGKAIDAAVEADRWDEAIAKAQDWSPSMRGPWVRNTSRPWTPSGS